MEKAWRFCPKPGKKWGQEVANKRETDRRYNCLSSFEPLLNALPIGSGYKEFYHLSAVCVSMCCTVSY